MTQAKNILTHQESDLWQSVLTALIPNMTLSAAIKTADEAVAECRKRVIENDDN